MNPPADAATLALNGLSLVTALGTGLEANWQALRAGRSALAPCRFDTLPVAAYAGEVTGLDEALPRAWAEFDCRNNRLAQLAMRQDGFLQAVEQARAAYG